MRNHLLKCFRKKELVRYPTTRKRSRRNNHFPYCEIEVFCSCQMPESYGDMIQCDKCERWYHIRRVGLSSIPQDTELWHCHSCCWCVHNIFYDKYSFSFLFIIKYNNYYTKTVLLTTTLWKLLFILLLSSPYSCYCLIRGEQRSLRRGRHSTLWDAVQRWIASHQTIFDGDMRPPGRSSLTGLRPTDVIWMGRLPLGHR